MTRTERTIVHALARPGRGMRDRLPVRHLMGHMAPHRRLRTAPQTTGTPQPQPKQTCGGKPCPRWPGTSGRSASRSRGRDRHRWRRTRRRPWTTCRSGPKYRCRSRARPGPRARPGAVGISRQERYCWEPGRERRAGGGRRDRPGGRRWGDRAPGGAWSGWSSGRARSCGPAGADGKDGQTCPDGYSACRRRHTTRMRWCAGRTALRSRAGRRGLSRVRPWWRCGAQRDGSTSRPPPRSPVVRPPPTPRTAPPGPSAPRQ
jgi:hypothetical protein